MATLTQDQTIENNGQPTFVLVPWEQSNRLRRTTLNQIATALGIAPAQLAG